MNKVAGRDDRPVFTGAKTVHWREQGSRWHDRTVTRNNKAERIPVWTFLIVATPRKFVTFHAEVVPRSSAVEYSRNGFACGDFIARRVRANRPRQVDPVDYLESSVSRDREREAKTSKKETLSKVSESIDEPAPFHPIQVEERERVAWSRDSTSSDSTTERNLSHERLHR